MDTGLLSSSRGCAARFLKAPHLSDHTCLVFRGERSSAAVRNSQMFQKKRDETRLPEASHSSRQRRERGGRILPSSPLPLWSFGRPSSRVLQPFRPIPAAYL